jgi:hypothetical protein
MTTRIRPLGAKLFLFVTLGSCVIVLVSIFLLRSQSFAQLKAGCATAMQQTPPLEALETWLHKNNIPYSERRADYDASFKDILVSNGISRSNVERSNSCLFFEHVPVRGGFLARHEAFGYFVFSADGTLIGYNLFDAYGFL